MRFFVAALAVLAACSDEKSKPQDPAPIKPTTSDAGVITVGIESGSGMHLDDDLGPRTAQPPPNRPGRPIDITLRSTPPNAQAAVDGVVVGVTPTYWSGDANGRIHEFTFVLPNYAVARYRFVPITSGVIHARLEPIGDDVDAGVPPPEVVPRPAPMTPRPPPPPPTIVTPVDAMTIEPAPPGRGPEP